MIGTGNTRSCARALDSPDCRRISFSLRSTGDGRFVQPVGVTPILAGCSMRWVRWVSSAMSSPVAVAGLLLALAAACHAPTPVSDPKLGAGVRDALAPNGEAKVIVALAAEAGTSSGGTQDVARAGAAIAQAQDAVLATLDSADFRLGQRFAAVPAFTGTLRSSRALDRLLSHPLVRRVDLDAGGTGSSVR